MPKNTVQFQKGYSLPEFFHDYGTEEQCEQALFRWRWPDGFVCPNCHSTRYCKLKCRKLYQCHTCRQQTSLTAGTIFAGTKLPLFKWFLAMHLLTQSKNGLSALALKRNIGVSYNTAWMVKQKIMQVMKERDDSKPLQGTKQLDDVYIGGELVGGKPGRGSENKTPIVAAVACNDEGHPIRMNLNVVKGFQSKEIARWAQRHVAPGSTVVSDGLACFSAVTVVPCEHESIVTGGGPKSVTSLENLLARLTCVAIRTPPMPYRLLTLAEAHG